MKSNASRSVQVIRRDVLEKRHILILHDIRSAQNVGALFRTADAAGIGMIYLSATTPAPLDQFNRPNPQIAKTALGAEQSIPWKQYVRLPTLLASLAKKGITTIAIEQGTEAMPSVDYKTIPVPKPGGAVAFVLGNEVTGLPEQMLALCGTVAEIPMKGMKESLNVSVAGGIAMFRILDC